MSLDLCIIPLKKKKQLWVIIQELADADEETLILPWT